MRTLVLCCVLGLSAGAMMAQTMVEAAILTGATATGAAAKGKGIGASIGTVFGKVNGTLAGAAGGTTSATTNVAPARTSSSSVARPSAPEPPLPKPSKTDFEGVETGMPREQLLAKVGKPLFSLSQAEQGHLEEVMRYTTKDGSSAKVKVTDGKVSSIEWSQPK